MSYQNDSLFEGFEVSCCITKFRTGMEAAALSAT